MQSEHNHQTSAEKKYGQEGIRNFLWEYRKVLLSNNLDKPINFTNGPQGITPITRPPLFFEPVLTWVGIEAPPSALYPLYFYAIVLLIVGVVILVNRRLEDSHIGRAWEAIREDEVAAQAMGVPLVRMKLLAFACGASFAGIMGVVFSAKQVFINPESFTFLESIGVLGPNVLLAHCLGLDEAEIDCLARSGTMVAMCPVTAAKGGRGVSEHGRMPELLARGVRIALGCDSPNNSNHLDMVRTMNMAAIQYKDARQDTRQIPAEAALEMATIHGAEALGLGAELGSIEAGKKADLVAFDTLRPEWQALWNPVNNLVYNADGRSVHTVVIDGRVVVAAYRQAFVDEARLYARVQEIGERLQARTGISFPRSRWPMS